MMLNHQRHRAKMNSVYYNLPNGREFQRNWCSTSYGEHFQYNKSSQPFILMSYNILAQDLLEAHSNLYQECDAASLKWNHRLRCLKCEIESIKPDILCLQEVQESHLDDIAYALHELRFDEPLYKKRTGGQTDGCAIFFNKNLFQLIDHHFVEYYQPDVKTLDRTNVAIIAKFALKKKLENSVEFCVTTTHLLYNPRRCDIRTAQSQVLLAEIDRMAYHSVTHEPISIILTGDFNCQPISVTYRLIVDGELDVNEIDRRFDESNECEALLPSHLGITDHCQHHDVVTKNQRHSTPLFHTNKSNDETSSSSENGSKLTNDALQQSGLPFNTKYLKHYLNLMLAHLTFRTATTFHDEWIMTDYIYYTKFKRKLGTSKPPEYSCLQLLKKLDPPYIKDCVQIGPIPNIGFGSDHFSLAAEFVLMFYR